MDYLPILDSLLKAVVPSLISFILLHILLVLADKILALLLYLLHLGFYNLSLQRNQPIHAGRKFGVFL